MNDDDDAASHSAAADGDEKKAKQSLQNNSRPNQMKNKRKITIQKVKTNQIIYAQISP